MDYKDILRNKADRLQNLLNRYGSKLSEEEKNSMLIIIRNTYEITNGRLDALDYSARNEGIMNYHAQLDSKISKFREFEQPERE